MPPSETSLALANSGRIIRHEAGIETRRSTPAHELGADVYSVIGTRRAVFLQVRIARTCFAMLARARLT